MKTDTQPGSRKVAPLVLALLVALLLCASPARADTPSWLRVERSPAASSCPAADQLSEAVAREPFGNEPQTEVLSSYVVEIDAADKGFTAKISVTGANAGTRTLTDVDATCAGLSRALAVTLAILLDEERRTRREALLAANRAIPPPAPPPATPPLQPPPSHDEPMRVLPPLPPTRFGALAVALGGGGTVGLGPSATGVALADVSVRLGRASAELGAMWIPQTEATRGVGGVDVSLASGLLRGCGSVLGDRDHLHLDGCGEAAVGALFGKAHGYDSNDSATRPWVALGGGLVVGGPLGPSPETVRHRPLSWFFRVDMLFPVRPQGFDVRNVGQVYTPDAGGGLGTIGLRFTFP